MTVAKINNQIIEIDAFLKTYILIRLRKNGPKKTIKNTGFNIVLFICLKDIKNPKSSNLPIPVVTALDHVKQRPADNPVNNTSAIIAVFSKVKLIIYCFDVMLGGYTRAYQYNTATARNSKAIIQNPREVKKL